MALKITKKKEVISEEIEVEKRTYCFERDLVSYRVKFYEDFYTMEVLHNFANIKGVRINVFDEWDSIPYQFEQFVLEGYNKEIEEEQFLKEKQEILSQLKIE